MKTPAEIVAWLKSHKWYRSYVKHTRSTFTDAKLNIANKFINGEKGIDTITGAFIWSEHPYRKKNGISFWGNIDYEFKDWFKS